MTRKVIFAPHAREEYVWWQTQDKKILKRINQLIVECQRDPFEGIGKPEPLKGNLAGAWSRRIDDANRFVYTADDDAVYIAACRYHYGDK
ncbi:Txe/YoeB family addiction module toxin [Cupriavidus pinatubonensis]|uniref:Txe/YoeB family addiction module toxin n=1 Tax=Cupriavidus pinatubonensis TaxID=248026 RepID=UPI00112B6494|nr:Txe/YoeB family addiction module toxin [Cupriavidus pinatubonensis]TPQ30841.1 Txe/YoeB family addiction module toxin [Cupriavidus pinatubonensis]